MGGRHSKTSTRKIQFNSTFLVWPGVCLRVAIRFWFFVRSILKNINRFPAAPVEKILSTRTIRSHRNGIRTSCCHFLFLFIYVRLPRWSRSHTRAISFYRVLSFRGLPRFLGEKPTHRASVVVFSKWVRRHNNKLVVSVCPTGNNGQYEKPTFLPHRRATTGFRHTSKIANSGVGEAGRRGLQTGRYRNSTLCSSFHKKVNFFFPCRISLPYFDWSVAPVRSSCFQRGEGGEKLCSTTSLHQTNVDLTCNPN